MVEFRFKYDPLDIKSESRQIRLLKLLPAKIFTDDIRCTIFHTSLEDDPVYEALSYVWGTEENPSLIHLSRFQGSMTGVLFGANHSEDLNTENRGSTRLSVTQNLEAALRHIRLPELERTMWIDAVCINQVDSLEKTHQVSQMRHIYLGAKQVVLWLGEERDSAVAIKFLREIPLQENGCADYRFNSLDIPKWAACDDLFFKRPYWGRTWILQEVLHDRDIQVYVGNHQLTIEKLFTYFNKYYYARLAISSIGNAVPLHQQLLPKTKEKEKAIQYDAWFRTAGVAEAMPDALVTMRPQFKDSSVSEPRLGMLLYKFRDQKSKEPKDKIYSLMGMAKKEYDIPIDYNDPDKNGLTKRDLYTIVTRQLLSRILLVLLWIESPQRHISSVLDGAELPSWVPDFTQEQRLTPRCMNSTYTCFNADDGFPGAPAIKPRAETENLWNFTIRGVYAASITGTRLTNVTKNWSDDSLGKDFDQLKLIRYDQNLALRDATMQSEPWPANSTAPAATFENTSWGPCKAEIGDIIIVAAGCKIPLVLRKHDCHYLFVGACWLIDSQIEDITELKKKDSAFSPLMYGSIIKEIGVTCEVEEFNLC